MEDFGYSSPLFIVSGRTRFLFQALSTYNGTFCGAYFIANEGFNLLRNCGGASIAMCNKHYWYQTSWWGSNFHSKKIRGVGSYERMKLYLRSKLLDCAWTHTSVNVSPYDLPKVLRRASRIRSTIPNSNLHSWNPLGTVSEERLLNFPPLRNKRFLNVRVLSNNVSVSKKWHCLCLEMHEMRTGLALIIKLDNSPTKRAL